MHSRCKQTRIYAWLEVEAINYVSAHDNETLRSCSRDVGEWVCDWSKGSTVLERAAWLFVWHMRKIDDFGGLDFYRVVNADPYTYIRIYNYVYLYIYIYTHIFF